MPQADNSNKEEFPKIHEEQIEHPIEESKEDSVLDKHISIMQELEQPQLQNFVEDNQPLVKQHKTIRFASYNILTSWSYPQVAEESPEYHRQSWVFRKYLLLDMMKQLNVDVWALQEVSLEQFHFLKKQLPQFDGIGYATHTGHSLEELEPDEYVGEIVPIFYHRDTMTCLHSQVFWLSPTPEVKSTGWDASRPRIITCGVFQYRTGEKIIVSNTHYDHQGDQALVNSGILEVQLLEQYKQAHQVSDIIYMGDRNCFTKEDRQGTAWYKTFLQRSEANDSRLCGQHVGLSTTFLGYHHDSNKASYNHRLGRFEPKTLDLIFHKGSHKIVRSLCTPGEYEVNAQGAARLLPFFMKTKAPKARLFVSDHCCVMADLEKDSHEENARSASFACSEASTSFF